MSQYHRAVAGGLMLEQQVRSERPLFCTDLIRKLTHPLPRGGTDLIASGRYRLVRCLIRSAMPGGR